MDNASLGLEELGLVSPPKKPFNTKGAIRKDRVPKLLELLENDENLKKDSILRMEYTSLAKMFLEDFKGNINKSSIEMNDTFDVGIDTWQEFLKYPPVRKYIQAFKAETMASKTESMLMRGEKEAVNIQKLMWEQGAVINNSQIVLMRLPEKRFVTDEETSVARV